MARLTDEEKAELLRMASGAPDPGRVAETAAPSCVAAPPRRRLTPLEYAEFATFAARFDRSRKPVAFAGTHWKL